MSLSLLQGYSSGEEDEPLQIHSSDEDCDKTPTVPNNNYVFNFPPQSGESTLPSALDAFSEITGPPGFLNNSVEEQASIRDNDQKRRLHGGRRNRKNKENLPAGSVVAAKAQLVGIHERVRSDIGGSSSSVVQSQKGSSSTTQGETKRVVSASNPSAEDAAELLRMCLQCGVPKTYSSARGMVCPICGDRPPADPTTELEKKKGSTIKDKEKNKRMKGQSSHATWKSETEMQLRQQFD